MARDVLSPTKELRQAMANWGWTFRVKVSLPLHDSDKSNWVPTTLSVCRYLSALRSSSFSYCRISESLTWLFERSAPRPKAQISPHCRSTRNRRPAPSLAQNLFCTRNKIVLPSVFWKASFDRTQSSQSSIQNVMERAKTRSSKVSRSG